LISILAISTSTRLSSLTSCMNVGMQAHPLKATVRDDGAKVRIPLIADTHSKLIADSVPGDRGHPWWDA
jgi:hypothetical protein